MPLRNRRLEMGKKPIKGLANAVDAQDAVPKSQMDTAIAAVTTTTLGAVPTSRTITAGTGLSGGGDLSANRTLSLADTAVSPGSYTLASITVDQQGRLTSASSGTAGKFTDAFKTSADQSVTSSTTFVDATDLTFSVAANTLYAFRFVVPIVAGAGNLKFGVNGPTLTALYVSLPNGAATTAYDTIIGAVFAGTAVAVINGTIECSASGTFALRFAQGTSNGAASTIKKGAYVTYGAVA